jgi:hypothetical protein
MWLVEFLFVCYSLCWFAIKNKKIARNIIVIYSVVSFFFNR